MVVPLTLHVPGIARDTLPMSTAAGTALSALETDITVSLLKLGFALTVKPPGNVSCP
jgi:hypothetical protein